jgi:ABC-type antimicrobial peptide transport system permease subunit
MERHEWSAWMGFLSLVAILFGVVVGIGFTLGIGRSFLSTKVDDGDATRARCVQDCKSWARERTDEDREFCAEPERNCKGGPERFARHERPEQEAEEPGLHAWQRRTTSLLHVSGQEHAVAGALGRWGVLT